MENIKIMAVDDEQYVLDAITQECSTYTIETETIPMTALERIREKIFDIFIIDYRMPIINGFNERNPFAPDSFTTEAFIIHPTINDGAKYAPG